MSYTVYGYDLFAGTSGTALTSHTPDSGGSWPTDSAHANGTSIDLDGSGMLYLGGGDTSNLPSWTMPTTANFEVYWDYERLSALSLGQQVMGSIWSDLPTGTFTSITGLLCKEPGGGTGAATGIFFGNNTNTPLSATPAALPAVGTKVRLRVRVTTSGGNSTLDAAMSTDGGVTYTDLAISVTIATPTQSIAVGPWMANASGSGGWTATTGPHLGRFVLEDLSATTATLTGPTSGTEGQASTNFTATLDAPAGYGGLTVTPASSVSGDTLTPTSVTIAQGASSGTFTETPSTSGSRNISITTSPALTYSGSPIAYTATSTAATSYTLTGPSGGVVGAASTSFSVTPNGLYSGTITITPSGGGLTTAITLTWSSSATAQTFSITPSQTGTVTLTPTSSPQLGTDPAALHYTVSAAPSLWGYYSQVSGFTGGLSTVGYTVIAHDGTTYAARTTSGVVAIGNGCYAAMVSLPFSGGYSIQWDDGQTPTSYAFDAVSPLVVSPNGYNLAQAINLLLAAVANKTGSDQTVFYDTDGATARLSGTLGPTGDRTAVTQTPPV